MQSKVKYRLTAEKMCITLWGKGDLIQTCVRLVRKDHVDAQQETFPRHASGRSQDWWTGSILPPPLGVQTWWLPASCGLSKGGHHLKRAKKNNRLEPHSSSKPLNRRTVKGLELCCFFICANTTQTKYDWRCPHWGCGDTLSSFSGSWVVG